MGAFGWIQVLEVPVRMVTESGSELLGLQSSTRNDG